MQPIYVAITGTKHYYGTDFLKPGQLIHLIKEPENVHDREAIKVELMAIGAIGYVANSPHTVPKGYRSVGRIYDTFGRHICGVIRFIVNDTAIVGLAPGLEEVWLKAWGRNQFFQIGRKN
ncbi:DNA-binding protein [Paenibacillus macerans]|uniref:DNA-binding protein n=1 Tax=Paenibacillus macerans TaxID=44252 RepID=A0A6N8EZQ2_PAEMA|nr:DNA-binding protein [Paenibacillus macerans]